MVVARLVARIASHRFAVDTAGHLHPAVDTVGRLHRLVVDIGLFAVVTPKRNDFECTNLTSVHTWPLC